MNYKDIILKMQDSPYSREWESNDYFYNWANYLSNHFLNYKVFHLTRSNIMFITDKESIDIINNAATNYKLHTYLHNRCLFINGDGDVVLEFFKNNQELFSGFREITGDTFSRISNKYYDKAWFLF